MKQLEDKIREALPRLKELTDGAIIYKPHWNIFSQKFEEDIFDEIEYRYGRFFEDGEPLMHFKLDESYYVGHPIKLNDVLEWCTIEGKDNYFHFEASLGQGVFRIYDCEESYSLIWDLSSVYLSDQSEELKEYLNSL